MKNTVCLVAILFFCVASQAEEHTVSGFQLARTSGLAHLGSGYLPQTFEATIGNCAKPEGVKFTYHTHTEEAFAKPQIIDFSKTTVYAVYSAHPIKTVIRSVSGALKYRNEPACGSQFISEIEFGTSIWLTFSFTVDPKDHDRLVTELQNRLTDLRSIHKVKFNDLNLTDHLVFLKGSGASGKLALYVSSCVWSNEDCDLMVEQAYTEAAAINQQQGEGKDVIYFKARDY